MQVIEATLVLVVMRFGTNRATYVQMGKDAAKPQLQEPGLYDPNC